MGRIQTSGVLKLPRWIAEKTVLLASRLRVTRAECQLWQLFCWAYLEQITASLSFLDFFLCTRKLIETTLKIVMNLPKSSIYDAGPRVSAQRWALTGGFSCHLCLPILHCSCPLGLSLSSATAVWVRWSDVWHSFVRGDVLREGGKCKVKILENDKIE